MRTFHFVIFGSLCQNVSRPLPVKFDQAYGQLESTRGVFIEPDGSFVWNGESGERIEGQLFDQGDFLNSVVLSGRCTDQSLASLVAVFVDGDLALSELTVQCNETGQVRLLRQFLHL